MTQQTTQTTPDWLPGIGASLPETPCGEAPRYLNEFQRVKEEIDKLRDVDYAMILTTCRDLLTRVTKDLRIGGYHLVAGIYVEGLPGMLDGLRAYRALLDNFWEDCHPKNQTGRLAALGLLSNPRIVAFAEQKEESGSFEILEALHQELDLINSFLTEKLGEEVPRLTGLASWVDERLRRLKASSPATENVPAAEAGQRASGVTKPGLREVNSEQGVETMTRQIHRHLINSGDFLRAMAYSRAFRWGKLVLPPNEEGRTRIPAPRASGLAELEQALSSESLERALAGLENLFYEPGFQLLFDLQYQTFQYFETNHRPDLAGFIRNALQDLLERHPQLLELQFDDGSSFAGSECRQWVRQWQMAGISGGGQGAADDEAAKESVAALVDQAMQLAKRKKLPEALQTVHSLPSGTEKQRIQKRLTEARLCLASGKAPIAEVVLADIQKYILDHHLATWDPGLAIEVFKHRLAALQSLEKSGLGEEKRHIAQQAQEVRQLICRIDVIAAAAII